MPAGARKPCGRSDKSRISDTGYKKKIITYGRCDIAVQKRMQCTCGSASGAVIAGQQLYRTLGHPDRVVRIDAPHRHDYGCKRGDGDYKPIAPANAPRNTHAM